jgi:transcriptional regulator with XRE-family HTH domain
VAWEAGVAQGSIAHYEQGKNEIPLGVLIELCRALKVAPVQIVPGLASVEGTDQAARAS